MLEVVKALQLQRPYKIPLGYEIAKDVIFSSGRRLYCNTIGFIFMVQEIIVSLKYLYTAISVGETLL